MGKRRQDKLIQSTITQCCLSEALGGAFDGSDFIGLKIVKGWLPNAPVAGKPLKLAIDLKNARYLRNVLNALDLGPDGEGEEAVENPEGWTE